MEVDKGEVIIDLIRVLYMRVSEIRVSFLGVAVMDILVLRSLLRPPCRSRAAVLVLEFTEHSMETTIYRDYIGIAHQNKTTKLEMETNM